MQKFSKQRELIRENMLSRYDHPTADMVYASLKAKIPGLSMATVYRNLAQFEEQKQMLRIPGGDGADRFDAHTHPHYHMFCKGCSRLFDVEMPVDSTLEAQAAKATGGKIERHNTVFYGYCKDCAGS